MRTTLVRNPPWRNRRPPWSFRFYRLLLTIIINVWSNRRGGSEMRKELQLAQLHSWQMWRHLKTQRLATNLIVCSCSFWVKPILVEIRKVRCLQVSFGVVLGIQIKFTVKLEQTLPLLIKTDRGGRDVPLSNLLSKITWYCGKILPVRTFNTSATKEE